jgi:hypothetical protein
MILVRSVHQVSERLAHGWTSGANRKPHLTDYKLDSAVHVTASHVPTKHLAGKDRNPIPKGMTENKDVGG